MESIQRVNYDSPYKEMSVLVVDDFEAITQTLRVAFERLGFKSVYKARDGKEALQYLKNYSVDLIVSDWKMPKMDGLALLQNVRESQKNKDTPFIMLTGNLQQSDVVQAIEAGVSEYLVKPFSKVTLAERVHKAFVSPIRGNGIASKERKDTTEEPKQRTILVVDDEPSNLQVLGELLKPHYKIKVCRSGQQALDICAKSEKPDLILLDIMMPEMDGLAVCDSLKSDPETQFIPIIFVSALSQTDDVVKGLKLGAVDYIQKPIIPEVVLARIDTHINSVLQREKLSQQIDDLIDASRHQDDALQAFFHDFRSPLTALHSTLVEMVSEQEEVQLLKESSASLVQMMEQYDLLTKLERGDAPDALNKIALGNTLQKVMASYQSMAKNKQLEFKHDIDPAHAYQGDDVLSYAMFSNLIANAIEAAPNKSDITVTSSVEDDSIVINMTNQGEVPAAIREHFFDKFVSSGKPRGQGLGAYSAKLCARAQGGEVSLNVADQQTTITLTFKVSQ